MKIILLLIYHHDIISVINYKDFGMDKRNEEMIDKDIKNKSLYKALRVLDCFSYKQPLTVTEISEKLGIYKSNVHDILTTFKAMGFVEQDEDTKRYILGPEIVVLSRAFRTENEIYGLLMPYVKSISEEADATVYLAVPMGDEMVYLDVVYAEGSKLMGGTVYGDRLSICVTASGKAVLASLPDEKLLELVENTTIEELTPYTLTDKKKLLEDIEITRKRGYGIDNMEVSFGYRCVGVSVCNRKGTPEAGISISAPTMRMTPEDIERYAGVLTKYKKIIEARL